MAGFATGSAFQQNWATFNQPDWLNQNYDATSFNFDTFVNEM